jgi:hypothetical protein
MAGEDQKLERDKDIKLLIARWVKTQTAKKEALRGSKKQLNKKINGKSKPLNGSTLNEIEH